MPLPTIPSGNVASATAGAYEVANSCRFNDGDSANMNKTFGTASHSVNKRFTYSFWVKRGMLGEQVITSSYYSSSYYAFIKFGSGDELCVYDYRTSAILSKITNRVFRDVSAWYHIVVSNDNSVSSPELKIYVNGVQETSFSTTNEYTQNESTSFGEYSEDSPTIWMPKDVSGLTFGTNGFYLDFEDSANLGNDANGGTDLTETNIDATDQATDTPTNNFCTMSPIASLDSPVMSQGNCFMTNDGSDEHAVSTFAASNGRWYFEVKVTVQNSNNALVAGISDVYMSQKELAEGWLGMDTGQYGYVGYDGKIYHADDGGTAHGDVITTNDILGVYVDLEDNKLYFSKNGTLQNSGTGYSITAPASTTGGAYHFVTGDWYGSTHNVDYGVNFGGCPAFAISSGNTDDNGYGNFEYSPNITGDGSAKKFYSLCTKNLAEYG